MSVSRVESAVSLGRCLKALLVASIPPALWYVTPLFFGSFGLSAIAFTPQIWLFCFIASLIGVFPAFVYSERLREPPTWLAVIWGTLVAWAATRIWFGPSFLDSPTRYIYGVAPGALSGIVYVLTLWRRRKSSRKASMAT